MNKMEKIAAEILWGTAGMMSYFFTALNYATAVAEELDLPKHAEAFVVFSAVVSVASFVIFVKGIAELEKYSWNLENPKNNLDEAVPPTKRNGENHES